MNVVQKMQGAMQILGRLSKREKTIFYGALVFVLLALLDRLIIGPAFSKMHALQEEIKSLEMFIKRDSRIVAQKEIIQAEKNKFSGYLGTVKNQEEQFTLILKSIEELANTSSVSIIDMKPAGTKKIDAAEKYIVNLTCEAAMDALATFMFHVEDSKELLMVEKYQLNPKSGGQSSASVSMVISKLVVH